MNYLKANLIAIDQLVNTLCGGWPDETLSSRVYRHAVLEGKARWRYPYRCINAVFFWQQDHCRGAYQRERTRRHLPENFHERK